ncbi:MAG: polysaccharide deacetylase family protein [Chloroflexi bacterium]|nr:MAG: polysaccharide deacetylase family protein [Chloroflexota bacterium]
MNLRASGGTFRLLALSVLTAGLLSACGGNDRPPWAGPATSPADTAAPSPGNDQSGEARQTASRFLGAFVDRDFDGLWRMLVPDAQSHWANKEAFSGFLERKFGSREISYEIGEPRSLGQSGASAVPVTIDFGDSAGRFAGPPLVLVAQGDSFAVSDAGPLGPRGALLGSPAAVRPELDVPILIYHHFAPDLPADPQQASISVTTSAFGDQLGWLADNGYTSITVAELYNAFYYDLPLPAKPVILVVDDGYAEVYQLAFPLLKEHGFGATIATITGAVDHPVYLTWDQIREMADSSIEFVSHSVTHGNLAAMSRDDVGKELGDSRGTLEEKLGRPVQFFVYPYGEPFVYGSDEARQLVLDVLRETGYLGALTTSSGPPYISVQRADAPYQLHRIPVSGGEALPRFVAALTAPQ